MATLTEVARKVADELTRTGTHPNQNNHVYASHLAALGLELDQALSQTTPELREDVGAFAKEMSLIMDMKEADKGKTSGDVPVIEALGQLKHQLERFQSSKLPEQSDMIRIFIHIANWAMIGRRAAGRGKIFK